MDYKKLIQLGLLNLKQNVETYYLGSMLDLCKNYVEREDIQTMAVGIDEKKNICLYYNKKFLDILSHDIKMLSYVLAHEAMHLFNYDLIQKYNIFDDSKLLNITQDCLINSFLDSSYPHILKPLKIGFRVPKEFKDLRTVEKLYFYLKGEENFNNLTEQNKENLSIYEKNKDIDAEDLLDNLSNIDDEMINKIKDIYNNDDIVEELINQSIYNLSDTMPIFDETDIIDIINNLDELEKDDIIETIKRKIQSLKNAGKLPAEMEDFLNINIIFSKKDLISRIKTAVSMIRIPITKKDIKEKTYKKLSKRDYEDLGIIRKGKKRRKSSMFVVILDVSGSMYGRFNEVLKYLNVENSTYIIIQADTQINKIEIFDDIRKLGKMKIVGYGGTYLQPAVDYYLKNYNNLPLIILTDGILFDKYLDFNNNMKSNAVIISLDSDFKYINNNRKIYYFNVKELN